MVLWCSSWRLRFFGRCSCSGRCCLLPPSYSVLGWLSGVVCSVLRVGGRCALFFGGLVLLGVAVGWLASVGVLAVALVLAGLGFVLWLVFYR